MFFSSYLGFVLLVKTVQISQGYSCSLFVLVGYLDHCMKSLWRDTVVLIVQVTVEYYLQQEDIQVISVR